MGSLLGSLDLSASSSATANGGKTTFGNVTQGGTGASTTTIAIIVGVAVVALGVIIFLVTRKKSA